MKNQIEWSIFLIVPIMFIFSLVCWEIISSVLVLAGMVVMAVVIITDIIRRKLIEKEQVFKVFCYALLLLRFGQLYDYPIVVKGALILLLVILFATNIFVGKADEANKTEK